jgi:hypothetical protein
MALVRRQLATKQVAYYYPAARGFWRIVEFDEVEYLLNNDAYIHHMHAWRYSVPFRGDLW